MQKVIGVDVGGTFTDVIYIDEELGKGTIAKVSSTPGDQSVGLLNGLLKVGAPMPDVEMIIHGTTVATNSLLERRGGFCGLITTKGFRDVIELRRRDRPDQYGLRGYFQPLIERERRLEVDERTTAEGEVLREVSETEIREVAKRLLELGVEGVVISFLHSYANPHNEKKAKKILESLWPNDYIVVASDLLPEFREFERTSTSVANAYVQPLIDKYLQELLSKLRDQRYKRDVLLVQSNGGLMSLEVSRRYPVNTVLSGPCAGVTAASYIAEVAGYTNTISLDMGGTSLDVCLIVDRNPVITTESELAYGIPIRVPMIDITTIGAGGGSIAWIDKAGILQIGPHSAGADPGPACYGAGGEEPTVTDANVVLGRINPSYLIGSENGKCLRVDLAEQAIMRNVGKILGYDVYGAAHAIVEVANNKMANSIRLISIDRGFDPREFVMTAFGGAGPLHATGIARKIGIPRVIVPYYPGITSAFGCIIANMRHDFVQTINRRIDDVDMNMVTQILQDQKRRGRELLKEENVQVETVLTVFEADMMYEGQTHVIRPVLPPRGLTKEKLLRLFEKKYKAKYKLLLEWATVMVVSLRTTVVGVRPRIELDKFFLSRTSRTAGLKGLKIKEKRRLYFDGRFVECSVYDREEIPPHVTISGPAVIEQLDATTFVEPNVVLTVDQYGNLIMEVN